MSRAGTRSLASCLRGNSGSSLPFGAKILSCRLTQSNSRDIFFSLLMATEVAPRDKEVPEFHNACISYIRVLYWLLKRLLFPLLHVHGFVCYCTSFLFFACVSSLAFTVPYCINAFPAPPTPHTTGREIELSTKAETRSRKGKNIERHWKRGPHFLKCALGRLKNATRHKKDQQLRVRFNAFSESVQTQWKKVG